MRPIAISVLLLFIAVLDANATVFEGRVLDAFTKEGIPDLTVKLIPPGLKGPAQQTQAALKRESISVTDHSGGFRFTVGNGTYLLELYHGFTLIYREAVTVADAQPPKNIMLTSNQAPATQRITVDQRHWKVLGGGEFAGNVGLYVGDIHATRPFDTIVFVKGPAQTGWKESIKLSPATVRKSVPAEKRLFDGQLRKNNLTATFIYNNRTYTLAGTLRTKTIGTDSLDVVVYAAATRK